MWTSSKAALAAAALVLPVVVLSGVIGADTQDKPPAGGYTLRCWQDGRLIVEEHHVTMPAVAEGGTRLQLLDRQRRPIVVAETRNATCVVRARPPERAPVTLP